MTLVVLFIGSILLVSALRNTYGALFTDLGTDVPKFVVWSAAIVALGAIGFVPGLKPVSRGLMALVLVVIILTNYKNILAGFQAVAVVPTPGTNPGSSIGPSSSGGGQGPAHATINYGYETPPSAYSSSATGH